MPIATGSVVVRGEAPVSLKASGAETSSTAGGATAMSTGSFGHSVVVTVAITASSGTTPTMIVDVQGSLDGTTFTTLGTFGANGYVCGTPATAPTNFTTTATKIGVFPSMPYLRYNSTIGGTTPSFTYSVTAQEV
jgi:hypothetical protein